MQYGVILGNADWRHHDKLISECVTGIEVGTSVLVTASS
jgi:hypothetical protein